jgi:hypothetical protein
MAELADAYGSGPYESNFLQVQILFPAPEKSTSQEVLFSGFCHICKAETLHLETPLNEIRKPLQVKGLRIFCYISGLCGGSVFAFYAPYYNIYRRMKNILCPNVCPRMIILL